MWLGPLAATTFSVPPDWGLVLVPEVAGAAAVDVELAFDEPDEPLELDEHAARPPAAVMATTSAATRLEDLDIGMCIFLLVFSRVVGPRQPPASWPTSITAYREILRYSRTSTHQIERCGSIVI